MMTTDGNLSGLQGYGVIYFGNEWFAENRTSSHHVAERLVQHVPVLYVDSPGMRPPSGSGRDIRRLFRKLAEAMRKPRRIGPNLWHCTVPQIPFRGIPGVALLNKWFGVWAVQRARRAVGFERVISWFVVPHPGFMANKLGEDLCVYYCIDDYSAHPGVDVARIEVADQTLSKIADLLFVAPPALLERKSALNPHTVFAPHGVDVALFGQARLPATVIPEVAVRLSKPVIGYFGSLAAWIDVELIGWLAHQRPGWSFLLIGHVSTDVSGLMALPNVTLVGSQPYKTLPAWAKSFDVAIIPYRQNRQVQNANPLKLREYLATGRPVVAVSNPEIERFADYVKIADTRESFLKAIEQSIEVQSPEAEARRVASVAEMTWDNRVKEVVDRLLVALSRRHSRS